MTMDNAIVIIAVSACLAALAVCVAARYLAGSL